MPKEMPWDGCKVGFGAKDPNEGDIENALDMMDLPSGWSIDEIDATGGRLVIVFEVEGPLRQVDGEKVRKELQRLGCSV